MERTQPPCESAGEEQDRGIPVRVGGYRTVGGWGDREATELRHSPETDSIKPCVLQLL